MSVAGDPAGPLIFLIAGEPSGDALGAALMAALNARTGGRVRFAGVGGERMAAQGLQSLVPIQDLAVMGLAEILPRARLILRRIGETAAAVAALNPDAVVTIDSFGFNSRVVRRLRRRGVRVPLIHYSAPHVWAWRHGRARRMAQWYDHLMVLLPFEPPYFAAVGLACTYVGHPVVETGADRGDGAAFRARHGIDRDRLVLAILPGSRRGEVRRLLPIFRVVLELLLVRYSKIAVVVPTIGGVAREVAAAIKEWPGNPILVLDAEEKYDAFAASDLAIAASGTVALELALAGVPMIVTYQVTRATAYLVRRMATVRFANLINLVLDRPAIPELLQEDCTPEKIAAAAIRLIDDPAVRESQSAALAEGLAQLGVGGISPSLQAADCVLAVIAERRAAA
jgi:lipid-A-disaccharide synthase